MNKIKILIIALLTILVSNNVNAQKAQPLVPHVTTFTLEKHIMESGVDLNTAITSIIIDPVYDENGNHIWGIVDNFPATTYSWSAKQLYSSGKIEVWIHGNHAWGHAIVNFSGSPVNVIVPIDVYEHPQENPHN